MPDHLRRRLPWVKYVPHKLSLPSSTEPLTPTTSHCFLSQQTQSHKLGAELRNIYLNSASPSFIKTLRTDLVDNDQVHVRVKAGGEGTVVFDSAIALLQGLFPPNPRNSIRLANGTEIVAPLGGYQYVPGELSLSRFFLQVLI